MPTAKICSRKDCQHLGKLQSISNFYIDNLRPAGYKTHCKDCDTALSQLPKRKASRARYWRSQAGKEASRRYQQSPKGRIFFQRAACRAYRANKIAWSIRSAINRSLRGKKNGAHWEDLVGFSLNDLIRHLEHQFIDGMTWDNYGEWHIDHIVPISAFNFNSVTDYDFKRCWSLTNLQPLWRIDNQHKHNRIPGGFQPSLIPGG